MTLLRRAPREVYRVYDEEEFLAGEESDECPQSACRDTEERRCGAGARARASRGRGNVVQRRGRGGRCHRHQSAAACQWLAPNHHKLARGGGGGRAGTRSRTRIWQARTVANARGPPNRGKALARAAAGSWPSQVQTRREIPARRGRLTLRSGGCATVRRRSSSDCVLCDRRPLRPSPRRPRPRRGRRRHTRSSASSAEDGGAPRCDPHVCNGHNPSAVADPLVPRTAALPALRAVGGSGWRPAPASRSRHRGHWRPRPPGSCRRRATRRPKAMRHCSPAAT